jgi:hypothetical protein
MFADLVVRPPFDFTSEGVVCMRKLRKMTRRRLLTILSLVFILALTTTTALAARPRFPSAITLTLTAPSGGTAQATSQSFAADLYHSSSSHPIVLVGQGNVVDTVAGVKYEVVINAKGKAEVVCGSGDGYYTSSPTTVDISASGSTKFTGTSSGHASFTVKANKLKLASHPPCSSDYSGDHDRVTIVKVLYSSGEVTLFERKGNNKDTADSASLASNGNDKNKQLDRVKFSKCKTKDLNVHCKQTGFGGGDDD